MVNYNIVINSNNSVAGSNSSNFVYNFDWSNIQEGEYELTFNFSSNLTNVSEAIVVACPDLGVSRNTFTTISSTSQQFNGVLGVIYPTVGTVSTSNDDYFVPATYNPPVYLQTRPYSSQFTINLYTNSGALVDLENEYIIILSLKKL